MTMQVTACYSATRGHARHAKKCRVIPVRMLIPSGRKLAEGKLKRMRILARTTMRTTAPRLLAAGVMTAGVMTAGVITAGVMTAGVMTAGVMTAALGSDQPALAT